MKRLSPRVNVIPVIGKADSLTPAELAESKRLVMEDIEHYRIPVYNFPYDMEEDDEDTVEENGELRSLMPFAIVGSEETVDIGGRKIRARQYPWGVVEVENPKHSDFLAIRSALLHSHLADLKEITHDFLYENYRTEKLSKGVGDGTPSYVFYTLHRYLEFLDANLTQRLNHEPRRSRLTISALEGRTTETRRREATRDRKQSPAGDQREATGASGAREPTQRDRGTNDAPRDKCSANRRRWRSCSLNHPSTRPHIAPAASAHPSILYGLRMRWALLLFHSPKKTYPLLLIGFSHAWSVKRPNS